MRREGSHALHGLAHFALPLAIASIFSVTIPGFELSSAVKVAYVGGLLPDIDHINIWFEYKFKNFRSFLRFVSKARRFRMSFLVFHNVAFMMALTVLIPVFLRIDPVIAVFFAAFLGHLCLDFTDDKYTIGRVTHWRYRNKT
jgi:hypothetical protein